MKLLVGYRGKAASHGLAKKHYYWNKEYQGMK